MDPLDAVLAIIAGLPKADRDKVKSALVMAEPSACSRQGHKFKVIRTIEATWLTKGHTLLYCERCGTKRRIET